MSRRFDREGVDPRSRMLMPAATFQLDTSGEVALRENVPPGVIGLACYGWGDLTPFQQGYVEALLREFVSTSLGQEMARGGWVLGFSDLSPEALALILKDCDGAPKVFYGDTAEGGAEFWKRRQERTSGWFPPLTVSLGDDGKVHIA